MTLIALLLLLVFLALILYGYKKQKKEHSFTHEDLNIDRITIETQYFDTSLFNQSHHDVDKDQISTKEEAKNIDDELNTAIFLEETESRESITIYLMNLLAKINKDNDTANYKRVHRYLEQYRENESSSLFEIIYSNTPTAKEDTTPTDTDKQEIKEIKDTVAKINTRKPEKNIAHSEIGEVIGLFGKTD